MYLTNFLLRLKAHKKNSNNKVLSVAAKVKLAKQIQGAKFFEVISCPYTISPLIIRCDLVNKSSFFSNMDEGEKVLDKVNDTDQFLIVENKIPSIKVPISESKSLINDFEIEIEIFRYGAVFDNNSLTEAFAQIVIHHSNPYII